MSVLLTEILRSPDGVGADTCTDDDLLGQLLLFHHARRDAIGRLCVASGVDVTAAEALHEIVIGEAINNPLTAAELARVLRIASPSVTALLDRLTNARLVRRAPHPDDRRKVLIRSTRTTAALLADARDAIVTAASALSPEDSATVTRVLHQISDVLESAAPPPLSRLD